APGLSGVFDDPQGVVCCYTKYPVHVGAAAADVYRQDGLGSLGYGGLEEGGNEIEAVCFDVDVHRLSPVRERRRGSGDERVRGGDDSVAGPYSQRLERQLDRDGAVGYADSVGGALELSEGLLELLDLGAGQGAPVA